MSACLLMALIALAAPADLPPDGTQLVVQPKATRVFKSRGFDRVALSDPEVADVTPKGSLIEVKGLKVGRARLIVWLQDGSQRAYEVVVGDPKTAPGERQRDGYDKPVSADSAGSVEDLAVDFKRGESREFRYSNVTRIVAGDPRVVDTEPLPGAAGVRLKAVGRGTATVQLFVGGRPAVRITAKVDLAAPAAAPPTSGALAGGRPLDSPDCTGDKTTPEVSKLLAESRDLEKAKKLSDALTKVRQAIELQPAGAHAYPRLGALRARAQDEAGAAQAYETFLLSCPTAKDAPRVRKLLEQALKAR